MRTVIASRSASTLKTWADNGLNVEARLYQEEPIWQMVVLNAGIRLVSAWAAAIVRWKVTKGSEERSLAMWVGRQRQDKKNGTITGERAALLETVPGWSWDPSESAWQGAYEQLLGWLDEHEGRYPSHRAAKGSEERSLAAWVNRQRKVKKNGRLSAESAALLAAVPGWSWDNRESAWQEGYGKLLGWLDEHEGRYPSHRAAKGSEERSLAMWVGNQRQDKKNGTITSERAALLAAVPGWSWDPSESAWQGAYGQLLGWLDEHEGRWPSYGAAKGSEELSLAVWVGNQRQAKKRGKTASERASMLEAVPGWRW